MRLIDADKLLQTINQQKRYARTDWIACIDRTIENINEAPTIEAEPVRYGKWITYKDEHQCSVCGEIICEEVHDGNWGSQGIYDFCPYCGARIKGVID